VSRILAYTSPARGHLFPIVPILEELQLRGHEIELHTLASQVELMRELGFDARPISPRIEAIELRDDHGSQASRSKRVMSAFNARARHDAADLLSAMETQSPDALLIDCMTWGAAGVAQASGRPWAQFIPYPPPLPSRDTPVYGPGFKRADGPLGRLRDRALRPLAAAMLNRMVLARLNAVRAQVGSPPLTDAADVFALAPLVLCLTAEPFEYARSDWPASVRLVGPCAWDPPAEPPDWLAQVDRPLVLVSTSSEHQDDRRLVTTALEAFAGEDIELVATLPAAGISGIEVPGNAHVEQFVPHAPLLARAACAITHGGAGVTQKALAAGVPVCVVPFGRDQHEVARRVELAGAGTVLSASRLNAGRLRARVSEAMSLRPGAVTVADAFAAAGGAIAAADAFEALLEQPARHGPPAHRARPVAGGSGAGRA
jgi:MGT family glycosyltransferase